MNQVPTKFFPQIEAPFVYGMTVFASLVGLLVYGTTLVRGGGGILDFLQPVFGTAYGLFMLVMLVAILSINRRWKGLAVIAAVYGLMLILSFSPTRKAPMSLNEYFALSAMLALLVVSTCLYYRLLDSASDNGTT